MPYNTLISELNTKLEDILEQVENETVLYIFALDKVENLLEKAKLYKEVFNQTSADDVYKKKLDVVFNKISQSAIDIQDKIDVAKLRAQKGSETCQI